jgi:hypothetical protein
MGAVESILLLDDCMLECFLCRSFDQKRYNGLQQYAHLSWGGQMS